MIHKEENLIEQDTTAIILDQNGKPTIGLVKCGQKQMYQI
jgi:hypothetical protein